METKVTIWTYRNLVPVGKVSTEVVTSRLGLKYLAEVVRTFDESISAPSTERGEGDGLVSEMEEYMDRMDRELAKTTIGQTYERVPVEQRAPQEVSSYHFSHS